MTSAENAAERRWSEDGVALLFSLILILVLTFMGFGFLTRALLVTQIAGAERWATKVFFAADGGINIGKARLRVHETKSFSYLVEDLRGYSGRGRSGVIAVHVSDFHPVGIPVMVIGSQTGGGQGSGVEPLYSVSYQAVATSAHAVTRSEAEVSSTQRISPAPLFIGPS